MPITKMKKGWPTLTTPLPFNGISVSAVPVGPREAGGCLRLECILLTAIHYGGSQEVQEGRIGREEEEGERQSEYHNKA